MIRLLTIAALALWVLGLSHKLEVQTAKVMHFSGLLAACMNGRPLFDRSTNTAHFCDRVISITNP